MPAKTGIVEVDDAYTIALDQDILRNEIGVNEAIAVALRPETRELVKHLGLRAFEQCALSGRECLELPESAPERILSSESLCVPRMSSKLCRQAPFACLLVDARGKFAHRAVDPCDRLSCRCWAVHDRAQLLTIDPREYIHLPLTRNTWDLYKLERIARFRGQGARNFDVRGAQRAHPKLLRPQRLIRVIPHAVDTHDNLAAIG